jgi:hypothetical protein
MSVSRYVVVAVALERLGVAGYVAAGRLSLTRCPIFT